MKTTFKPTFECSEFIITIDCFYYVIPQPNIKVSGGFVEHISV